MGSVTSIEERPDYAHEEKWDICTDSHLVARETPRWKVREDWAKIQVFRFNQRMQQELQYAHYNDFHDSEVAPLEHPPAKTGFAAKLEYLLDLHGVWICRSFHRMPEYSRGDLYCTCVCGRKYAVPFADPKLIPAGVYTQAPFVMPTERTMQAEVRGAHARLIDA